MQVNGKNYLIPVDANIAAENEVELESVDIDRVLAKMENARNGLNIIVLDACRNNPFTGRTRSMARGLAMLPAPKGTILAYATSPGTTADDGDGNNSPYTKALTEAIVVPDQTVEQVFKRAGATVTQASGQVPWYSSNFTAEFSFKVSVRRDPESSPAPTSSVHQKEPSSPRQQDEDQAEQPKPTKTSPKVKPQTRSDEDYPQQADNDPQDRSDPVARGGPSFGLGMIEVLLLLLILGGGVVLVVVIVIRRSGKSAEQRRQSEQPSLASSTHSDPLAGYPTLSGTKQRSKNWIWISIVSVVGLFIVLRVVSGIIAYFYVNSLPEVVPEEEWETIAIYGGHDGAVNSVAFSPDGLTIASGSSDNSAKIWRISDGVCLQTLSDHPDLVWDVAFSPDGYLLATVSGGVDEGIIKLWNWSTGECVATIKGHTSWIDAVAFSPDGATLATGSLDKTIKIWSLSDYKCIRTLTGHTDMVRSVAFSPDGLTLASGSDDQTIKIWRLMDGKCLLTLKDHGSTSWSIAYSPDGSMIAGGGNARTVNLWRTSDGVCVSSLIGYGGEVNSVAFSGDGSLLVSCANDNTISVRHLPDEQVVATLAGDWGLKTVAISLDGTTIAAGDGELALRVWRKGGIIDNGQ